MRLENPFWTWEGTLAASPALGKPADQIRPLGRGMSADRPFRPGHTLAFARSLV
jgi:hypothetical protein